MEPLKNALVTGFLKSLVFSLLVYNLGFSYANACEESLSSDSSKIEVLKKISWGEIRERNSQKQISADDFRSFFALRLSIDQKYLEDLALRNETLERAVEKFVKVDRYNEERDRLWSMRGSVNMNTSAALDYYGWVVRFRGEELIAAVKEGIIPPDHARWHMSALHASLGRFRFRAFRRKDRWNEGPSHEVLLANDYLKLDSTRHILANFNFEEKLKSLNLE